MLNFAQVCKCEPLGGAGTLSVMSNLMLPNTNVPVIYLTGPAGDVQRMEPPAPETETYRVGGNSVLAGIGTQDSFEAKPDDKLLPLGLCAVALQSGAIGMYVFLGRTDAVGLEDIGHDGGLVVLAQMKPLAVLAVDERQIRALHRVVMTEAPDPEFFELLGPIIETMALGAPADPINPNWRPDPAAANTPMPPSRMHIADDHQLEAWNLMAASNAVH